MDHMQQITSQIHRNTSGEIPIETDVRGQARNRKMALQFGYAADGAIVQKLIYAARQWLIAVVKGLGQNEAGLLRHLSHPLSFPLVGGQGFLAQDMFARTQRTNGPFTMQRVRQWNIDSIDI